MVLGVACHEIGGSLRKDGRGLFVRRLRDSGAFLQGLRGFGEEIGASIPA